MTFDILPTRTGAAAENMALDFLLLQRYPAQDRARFRHYEWRVSAFTFGYSQKIDFVRAQLPTDGRIDLCRRPTGGGVVDHRDDWTYALVIPRGHDLYDARASQSYRIVHEVMAVALTAQGQMVAVKPACDCPAEDENVAPGVCFTRTEVFDVMNSATGAKVAGAAQKRNKRGLLFQGSIWKPALGAIDWEVFEAGFIAGLAAALGAEATTASWPEFADGEVEGLIEQYSSPEWVEYR